MESVPVNEYAVNIADLTRWGKKPLSAPMMLLRPVLSEAWVDCEPKRFDGAAALFNCNEERASAIVSVLRMKIPKHLLRIYVREHGRKAWKRI